MLRKMFQTRNSKQVPNVSAKTIIVKNFDAHVTSKMLASVFREICKVSRVVILHRNENSCRMAYVVFENVDDLRHFFTQNKHNNLFLFEKRLQVQLLSPMRVESINDLPIEILAKILSDRILDVAQRIRNERVCKRWQNVSSNLSWNLYSFHRSLFPEKATLTDDDIDWVLNRCGPSVRHFVWSDVDPSPSRILQSVSVHCSNIESLTLHKVGEFDCKLKDVFEHCVYLKCLTIRDSKFSNEYVTLQQDLNLCQNLESLVIQGNEGVLGLCVPTQSNKLKTLILKSYNAFAEEQMLPLKKCEKLENIAFISCNINNSVLEFVFKQFSSQLKSLAMIQTELIDYLLLPFYLMTDLRVLVIANDVQFRDHALGEILLKCPGRLCTLNISGTSITQLGVHQLSARRDIVDIDLSDFQNHLINVNDELLHLSNMQSLKSLMVRNYIWLNDDVCIKITENCKSLQHLDITGCCQITNRTAEELKLQVRQTRLTVLARFTQISMFITTNNLVIKNIFRGQLRSISAISFLNSPTGKFYAPVLL